jgi:ADP-ribose pyrophosphatase YjhB (NUDIX family)
MSPSSEPPIATFCIHCGASVETTQSGDQKRQSCPSCGWNYYPKSNQASAVAILQDGGVLMVRRKDEPFKDHWTLPSGFLEYGEGPEHGAVRELREELNVHVELTGLVDVLMERGDPRGPCLLVVYTGRIAEGEPQAGDDASEVRSFPLHELPEKIAFKAHREALEKLREKS